MAAPLPTLEEFNKNVVRNLEKRKNPVFFKNYEIFKNNAIKEFNKSVGLPVYIDVPADANCNDILKRFRRELRWDENKVNFECYCLSVHGDYIVHISKK